MFGARLLAVATASCALGALVIACAEGSLEGEPEGAVFPDAGTVEASPIPPRGDADPPEPEPEEDGGTTPKNDSGTGSQCATALAAITFDFTADQGWTHAVSDNAQGAATWPFDEWSRGTSTSLACPGGGCFGFKLSQNYAQCSRGELVSPKINLSACSGSKVALSFKHAFSFWTGSYNGTTWYDGGIVEISGDDGASWSVPTATYPGTVKINPNRGASYACVLPTTFHVSDKPGFVGAATTPATFEIELPAAAITDKFRVRFAQAAGVSSQTTSAETSRGSTAPGWRIDDVHFVAK